MELSSVGVDWAVSFAGCSWLSSGPFRSGLNTVSMVLGNVTSAANAVVGFRAFVSEAREAVLQLDSVK